MQVGNFPPNFRFLLPIPSYIPTVQPPIYTAPSRLAGANFSVQSGMAKRPAPARRRTQRQVAAVNAPNATSNALLAGPLRLGSGRRGVPSKLAYERDLTVEELVKSSQEESGQRAPSVQQMRQSHHYLARLLASGTKEMEASHITGYTPGRISVLKSDPAFEELLTYYKALDKSAHENATVDMHKRLASLGYDSIEVLHERLLEDPAAFSPKDLIAVTELSADRTGFGKQSSVTHDHTLSLSGETISRIKANAQSGREASPEDREALLRLARRATEEYSEIIEAEWLEVGGGDLREESGEVSEEPLSDGDLPLPSVD